MIERIKSNKLLVCLFISIVVVFIILVVRITYAFIVMDINDEIKNVNLSSDLVDEFKFYNEEKLEIFASPTNLGEGAEHLVSTIHPKITLKANGTNNEANYNYYMYLNIKNNTFVYSSEDMIPEILLTITDPEGNPVTVLDDLIYTTVKDVSGFDVTTYNGMLTIANNYAISSTSSSVTTEHPWIVTLTYLNLDIDQSINIGHTMIPELTITKERMNYHDYCDETTLACSIAKKSLTDNTIYYHDETLTNGAEDYSYRYAGASDVVNNYVCFGSDEEACPDDNLYRIIGVFDGRVKLIKDDYATKELLGEDGDYKSNETPESTYKGSQTTIAKYYWNYKNDITLTYGSNNWSTSLLNKVNLNTNYLNNIGNVWSSKIAMITWYLGGCSTPSVTVKAMYGYERGTTVPSGNPKTYEAKVGLIYPSDYGFATPPSNWTTNLYDYDGTNVKNNNWLYLGEYEWTISPYSGGSTNVFFLSFYGFLDSGGASSGFGARPVFYLEASISITGGEGTKVSPYRIN